MKSLLAPLACAVLISAAILAGCGSSGPGKPAGAWGRLVSCLQTHRGLGVRDASSGSKVTGDSDAVAVSGGQASGALLAYVGDTQLGADSVTGSGAAQVNLQAGPIRYGYTASASPAQQAIVSGCVSRSGIGGSACAALSFGRQMTCSFALAIQDRFKATPPSTPTSNGATTTSFNVRDPGTNKSYFTTCQTLRSATVCIPIGQNALAVSFTSDAAAG